MKVEHRGYVATCSTAGGYQSWSMGKRPPCKGHWNRYFTDDELTSVEEGKQDQVEVIKRAIDRAIDGTRIYTGDLNERGDL